MTKKKDTKTVEETETAKVRNPAWELADAFSLFMGEFMSRGTVTPSVVSEINEKIEFAKRSATAPEEPAED